MRFARSFLATAALTAASSCSDTPVALDPGSTGPQLAPGEVCFDPQPEQVRVRFEPRFVVLAPGQRRQARVVVDPDMCVDTAVRFTSSSPEVAAAPPSAKVAYGSPTVDLTLRGDRLGTTTVQVEVDAPGGGVATAELAVEVLEAVLPGCEAADGVGPTTVAPGARISGTGGLAAASLALPAGADTPISNSIVWSVGAFEASLACADDIVPPGYRPLGPAVTFGPEDRVFPRELPLSIPLNPALLPEAARWRHLRLAYSGPRFKKPRTVAIADPRVEKVEGVWRVSFKAPRLGTYQAVVDERAGTSKMGRRLTHRAIVGVSMGGSGAAQLGLRHHHLFDAVAAMGGPVDWSWMMHHIEHNQLGGFRPIAPGTQLADIPLQKTPCTTDADCRPDERCLGVTAAASGGCTFLPPTDEPYEHASTFNTWWYEPNELGNGGEFSREDVVQMFRDIAYAFGNPVGFNPLAPYLPAGVDPDHPAQAGERSDDSCKVYVKPYDGPDKDAQDALWDSCPVERCMHTQVLTNYYDDEFNPDGSFPVITFCDGSPQNAELSPYASSWSATGNNRPVEVALAVDYNANGVRDELEPVIKAGHEPWDDWGTDGIPSSMEAGYGPSNLDPAGDDYDPQYNPTGTEGDHRYQPGEPFRDYGLDGVDGTAGSPYDHGEGDGGFTVAPGLQRFWDLDPRSIARGHSTVASQPLTDEALSRLDIWTDGGIRDLMNFSVSARHFLGNFTARGRDAAIFSDFNQMPGLVPDEPELFSPQQIVWEDLQGVVMQRYGIEDPDENDLERGTGMHVGTINEITKRLQSALYFIGSRWRDAPHQQFESAADKPAEGVPECQINGNCTFDFTSSFGRTGTVAVTLPPGYAHADLQHVRYPVVYVLHGYGMTPEDLQAAIVFLKNWMNVNSESQYSRLAKFILVYVDGRCRWQDGRAECIRGNFYTDSALSQGGQIDAWFLELVDHIDQRFRTMGESVIEWQP